MRAVPLIDLTPHFDPSADPAQRHRLYADIDRALCDIGFLCVRGHGIAPEAIASAQGVARRFFELDPGVKDSVRARRFRTRGWTPLGDHSLGHSMAAPGSAPPPPDLFERYRIGPFDLPDDDYSRRRSQTVFAPNVWPDDVAPAFRPAMSDWYRAMSRLSGNLMQVFACALGLRADWFDDKLDREMSSLVVNWYPVPAQPPLPGQLRASAHTDYGTLTIVAPTAEAGGLQVNTRDQGWEDVSVEPGTFVVNIGDLMAQWTNDRWVSTLHRVVNPPPTDAPSAARLSLVYFHQPNEDALVEAIPTCVAAGHAPRYEPVTAGEHIGRKIRRHFEVQRAA